MYFSIVISCLLMFVLNLNCDKSYPYHQALNLTKSGCYFNQSFLDRCSSEEFYNKELVNHMYDDMATDLQMKHIDDSCLSNIESFTAVVIYDNFLGNGNHRFLLSILLSDSFLGNLIECVIRLYNPCFTYKFIPVSMRYVLRYKNYSKKSTLFKEYIEHEAFILTSLKILYLVVLQVKAEQMQGLLSFKLDIPSLLRHWVGVSYRRDKKLRNIYYEQIIDKKTNEIQKVGNYRYVEENEIEMIRKIFKDTDDTFLCVSKLYQ